MYRILKEKIMESFYAVLPITMIVLLLSIFLVPIEVGTMAMFIVGAAMLIFGMGMFQLGADTAMSTIGEGIGVHLAKAKKIPLIAIVALIMGVLITIAEPDLQVLSNQVPAIPNATIIWTVAIGVGIFLSVAVLRIAFNFNLSKMLIILYSALLVLSFFIPKEFLAVAFDSGGVTTGPITVPFIMALGVGISSMRLDKYASSDSFGLVSLSSVGPILAVLILGCFYNTQEAAYSSAALFSVVTMRDVFMTFTKEIPHFLTEVSISILPIVLMSLGFQLLTHRYNKRQKIKITIGFGYTYIGLVLFLCGVNVGFAPVGTILGNSLAATSQKWLLIPIGMLIGYFIVKAEPAIQILNHQVQTITNGKISEYAMNSCLSIGVAVSVGLAMFRVLTGMPIQYIIIPGYILALVLSRLVPPIFVGIAFDSGGVASGPMTSTFLLPLCIGVCESLGGNIMTDAFGVVALVALTPLIAIQLMGLLYKFKLKKSKKNVSSVSEIPVDSDEIIEIWED
ncbi:MAG: DUF1538 domain-containing protein [Clostridia bacterium]|nr:DUF1538 domain-containing protein [Clostridia bacterium]